MHTSTVVPASQFHGFDLKPTKLERLERCGKFGQPYKCPNGHRTYHTIMCGSPFCIYCAVGYAKKEIPKLVAVWQKHGSHVTLFESEVERDADLNEVIDEYEEEVLREPGTGTPLAMATFVPGISDSGMVVIRILVLYDTNGNNLDKLAIKFFEPVIPKDRQSIEIALELFPKGFRRLRKKLFVTDSLSIDVTNNFPDEEATVEFNPTQKRPRRDIWCPCCGLKMTKEPVVPISEIPAHYFPPKISHPWEN